MNNTFPIDESVARVAESVPPSAELRNSLDVSERLVEEEETTNLEQEQQQAPTIAATAAKYSRKDSRTFLSRMFGVSPSSYTPATANVTERRQQGAGGDRADSAMATEDANRPSSGEAFSPPRIQPMVQWQERTATLQLDDELHNTELEGRIAVARRQTIAVLLETKQMEAQLAEVSRPASPAKSSPRSPPTPRSPSLQRLPTDTGGLAWILQHFEEQRREDRAIAEAQRREDRREDRREADERAERLEARHQAEMATIKGTPVEGQFPAGRYLPGQALVTHQFAPFADSSTEDWDAFQRRFERTAAALKIPETEWPNELILKLTGPAGSFCDTEFPNVGERPAWGTLTAALQRQFGRRYAAAAAWRALHTSARQPHEDGLAVLQRMRELTHSLTLLGVPGNPGPNERMCYLLQNNLGEDERIRWTARANATPGVSEASIRDKEAAATAALQTTSRHSIAVEERDGWFLPQRQDLENFFQNQTACKVGGGRGLSARAAPIEGEQTSPHSADIPPQHTGPPVEPQCAPPVVANGREARLFAAVAAWESRSQDKSRPVPAYHGSNRTHKAANRAEYEKRKANRECFKCFPAELVSGQLHYDCKLHGRDSTEATRRVVVAGAGAGGVGGGQGR